MVGAPRLLLARRVPGNYMERLQPDFPGHLPGDAVVVAVRDCWASLWTAQAINYRHEMDIAQDMVAMAVVVQIMIPSEVSGILFTANPATGEFRSFGGNPPTRILWGGGGPSLPRW